MKVKSIFLLLILVLCGAKCHAQFVVSDPINFAGNIVNTGVEVTKMIDQISAHAKEFRDLYEKVSMPVEFGKEMWIAGQQVSEIAALVRSAKSDLEQSRYLTVDERLRMMQAYAKLLKVTQQKMGAMKSLNGISNMNLHDRINLMQKLNAELQSCKGTLNYYTGSWRFVEINRINKSADKMRMALLLRR